MWSCNIPPPPPADSKIVNRCTQDPCSYKDPQDLIPTATSGSYRNDPDTLFARVDPVKELGNFHRVSYTYKVPRTVLYHTDGPDLMCVGPRFSRYSEWQHDGAPCGAAVQWPPYRAGTRVSKCSNDCYRSRFSLSRSLLQPCTTLLDEPASNRCALTCCSPHTFTRRSKSAHCLLPEYWESSMLPINHHGFLISPTPCKTAREYHEIEKRNAAYVKQLKMPTEYQERYIARLPVPHRKWD